MSDIYYSPEGNPEIWNDKPKGYYTAEAWSNKVSADLAVAKEKEDHAYLTYDNALKDKIDEVNSKFSRAMSVFTKRYPAEEFSTFDMQEKAARSFLAGSSEYVCYLTTLADNREITVPELVDKIVKNADAYHAYTAAIVGIRHKYVDLLNSFSKDTDPTIIRDIDVSYRLVD